MVKYSSVLVTSMFGTKNRSLAPTLCASLKTGRSDVSTNATTTGNEKSNIKMKNTPTATSNVSDPTLDSAINSAPLSDMVDRAYESFEGSEDMMDYCERHGVESLGVLTVYDDDTAAGVANFLAPRITGKVVVEIGAGMGLLACHLALYAKHVYAIEANPIWASCFAVALLKAKPKNCTYILGSASEMNGLIRADVAIFCTHSGAESMRSAAQLFSPVAIDVYADVLGKTLDPELAALRQPSARTRERSPRAANTCGHT